MIDKFNVQWSSTCKSKDYLFVGQIKTYTKVWLCGSSVPSDFSALVSKNKKMTVRFVSNGSTKKSGFKVRVLATGWSPCLENTQALFLCMQCRRFTELMTLIDDLTSIKQTLSVEREGSLFTNMYWILLILIYLWYIIWL